MDEKKETHLVSEGPGDDGIFHQEVAKRGLVAGVIMRMTCRWCQGEMDIIASTDPEAECIRNPDTGEIRMETVGLICPTCDAPAAKQDWGGTG